ncbi:MAG: ABC transporter permease [Vicinamibacteria bacterium]|nr:ABC transporter permease [Vicinamibacteria bacterium]
MPDLTASLRSVLRQRSFFLSAAMVLALGIAAPTAMFAVVRAALLKPLPYPNAHEIYNVRTTMTNGRFTIGLVGSEEIASMRRSTRLVTRDGMYYRTEGSIGDTGEQARLVNVTLVSEGFFDLFGVPMAMGRAPKEEDFKANAVRAAVLSTRVWRSVFSSDPGVVGRTVRLVNAQPVVVVGVAPESFDAPHDTDLWLATHWDESVGHLLEAYVRFAPGATPEAVAASLGPMWDALGKKYPDQEKDRVFTFRPMLDALVGDLGPTSLIAFAATGLLLLLAVANVANLFLARGAARAREIAMRVAIGARRRHLARQLLAEALVISAPAAVLGIGLAWVAVRAISHIGGASFPRAEELRFDPMVAAFAAGLMLLATLLVGLIPALTTADLRIASIVNEGGRGTFGTPRTRGMLAAFVVGEIALAIALVAGAGRLLMSARNLIAVDPGFDTSNRLIVDVLLPREVVLAQAPWGSERERMLAFSAEVERRFLELGATKVGMATSLPLRRERDATTFTDIVGRPVDPSQRSNGRLRTVNASFFDAMNIRLLRGRGFTVDDRAGNSPVVVVNEAWVKRSLPQGVDPLREQIDGLFARKVGEKWQPWAASIIGVVADVRYASLDREAEPTVFVLETQRPPDRRSYVLSTPDGHPERLMPRVREALASLNRDVSVQFDTMSDVLLGSMMWSRLGVLLMTTIGLVALALVGAGVFGVLAFAGAQRHGEMAVRLCLGAEPSSVFRLMLGQTARYVLAGGVLGLVAAGWMGQLMSAYVYQVSAANGFVLVGSLAMVSLVAALASLLPAMRAAAVEPSRVLRG